MTSPTRMDRLQALLERDDLEALVVTGLTNQRYLCGYTGHAAHLVVTAHAQYLVTDYRYAEIARESAIGVEVVIRDRLTTTLPDALARVFAASAVRRAGFESKNVSYADYELLELAGVAWTPTQDLVEELRYSKESTEVDAIRKAAGIADAALAKLLKKNVKVGATEIDLARALEGYMFEGGAEGLAFPTIMLSGPRSALPHGQPTDRKLAKGDLLLIDFGAVIDGYNSDMTRTYVLGKPKKRQKAAYDAVMAAQQAGIDALAPDVNADVPYLEAKAILDDTEFGEYAGEGLGHGLGLDLHERPLMGFPRPETLAAGCVVTVEPGVYIPGWGGVRLEDDVLITDDEVEMLTRSPREFVL